jgi:hypothetical protein
MLLGRQLHMSTFGLGDLCIYKYIITMAISVLHYLYHKLYVLIYNRCIGLPYVHRQKLFCYLEIIVCIEIINRMNINLV